MPVHVGVVQALEPAQVAEVGALCDTAAAADGVQPLSEHVRLHLRHGGEERRDRHVLAERRSGIVGYAHLDPTDPVAGPVAELVVHPDHRRHGVGRDLLAAAIGAARGETGTDRLRLWAHGGHPAAWPLAKRFGFTEGRRLEQWQRPLDDDLPPVPLPEGVRLRSFRVGEDEPAWLELNARAFADHPEQGGWTRRDLEARLAEPWFDPDGFLLAVNRPGGRGTPERLIGFHWTKVHGSRDAAGAAHGHDPIGEVYVVGVDPDHQGRGLGRSLTLAGLRWLAGRGLARAMLYVEGDNAAAQATYRALGFRHWDTDVMFYRG